MLTAGLSAPITGDTRRNSAARPRAAFMDQLLVSSTPTGAGELYQELIRMLTARAGGSDARARRSRAAPSAASFRSVDAGYAGHWRPQCGADRTWTLARDVPGSFSLTSP